MQGAAPGLESARGLPPRPGKVLTLPLIFGQSGSDYVVVASKGGAPAHPAWYLNLEANPEVQVKADKFTARRQGELSHPSEGSRDLL
jgi:hypothetical protein